MLLESDLTNSSIMKKFITLTFIVACLRATAQDSLKILNTERSQATITGMRVLDGWGLVNIGVGAAGWAASKGGQNRYFYQMTTVWGLVNEVIAVPGHSNARYTLNQVLNPAESLKEQQKIEHIFLVNSALDVVYIGAGFYLDSRGSNSNNAQLK